MPHIKSALILTTTLALFAAGPVMAQSYGSGVKDKATEKVKTQAVKKAKQSAKDVMTDAAKKTESYGSGKVEGASEKVTHQPKVKGAYGSDNKDGHADKASYGSDNKDGHADKASYGSDKMQHKADKMDHMSDKMEPATSTTTVLNCPAGTKGQADGTCMIVGNYVPRS